MINYMTIDGYKIGVWTVEHMEENPCVAVNMSEAIEQLEGYSLTKEEKTDVTEMLAGYCRLIDEGGLSGFGETEFEAIADLFSHAHKI